MSNPQSAPTGKERFSHFRDMIRAEGFSLSCQSQVDNLEIWSITGANGYTRIAVIIGEDGFDLFFASDSISMQDDLEAIKKRLA